MTDHRGVPSKFFHEIYEQVPPWEVGVPQPEVVRLAQEGRFQGRVLDIGGGTGENALLLASLGLEVTSFDLVPAAVERARAKAGQRGLQVDFRVASALEMADWCEQYDTALDSGVFHVFSNEDRPRFHAGLRQVLKPGGRFFLLCFSELETSEIGPRRLSEAELRGCFAVDFEIEELRRARYASLAHPGGAHAWLAQLRRVKS
jgi:2-polyprenyl-3-methyl-5-hydroxy-6-metoxy-1,4-benzoquinol methylase